MDAMGVSDLGITCGAVCVYSSRIPDAVKALKDARSSVPIASVAAGFPAGNYFLCNYCSSHNQQISKFTIFFKFFLDATIC